MARVNVDKKALSDRRFHTLGRRLGISRWDALGRMVAIWDVCQEEETHRLTPEVLADIHPDLEGLADAIVFAQLGREEEDGSIYIAGTRGRIEWLGECRRTGRENGKKGGRPPKTKTGSQGHPPENQEGLSKEKPRGVSTDKTKRGSRQKTPPAPAPAPVGALPEQEHKPRDSDSESETVKFSFPSGTGGLRSLGDLSADPTVVEGFVISRCPIGPGRDCITQEQVRTLCENGLTMEGAKTAITEFERRKSEGLRAPPGPLLYTLLEEQLDADARRELRGAVRSRQRAYQEAGR